MGYNWPVEILGTRGIELQYTLTLFYLNPYKPVGVRGGSSTYVYKYVGVLGTFYVDHYKLVGGHFNFSINHYKLVGGHFDFLQIPLQACKRSYQF